MVSTADVPRGQWMTHLCGQIRDAIRAGVLRPGVRLPSTRTLAADLGLSRGVVLAVYDQLQAEGYLDARRGSGTIVATTPAAIVNTNDTSQLVSPGPIQASPGLPDTGLFPRKDWLKAYATALRQLPDSDLHYGDPQGLSPLRAELADYLGRVRGLRTSPDRILIVNGFAQGLAVLARILPTINIDAVAVEEPGSTGTRNQLRDWGIETPPADVDDDGLHINSLEQTDARAVLVTPAHHYPTGVVLAPQRRRELIRWVHQKPGRLIIEDDYDAEFRYDHAPVGSLQPLAPDHVITGSSVSKTLAPALRLGWLVLPASLIDQATRVKATFDLGTCVLSQAALVQLLRTGALDRHLRRSRLRYRHKRQQIANRLTHELPDARITGLEAGLNLCIQLDHIYDDRALAGQLKNDGVRCEALSYYQQRRHNPQPGLVIDITATTDDDLEAITSAIRMQA